jgi:SAM-dependent methyltransferase
MPEQATSIEERISAFPNWHYEFDLQGHRTPIFDPAHRNRHAQRERYFFDPLVRLCGGSLAGKRVLDLGCNAGYWSLLAAKAGADYVLGIDGRDMHVEQANFVFEASGISRDRYEFRTANLFDLSDLGGQFDVVLNLGLMYHIAKHMQLMELIAAHATDLVVTDTEIAPGPGSFLRLRRERTDQFRNAVDYELIMIPSRRAIIELGDQFGFKTVVLTPRFTSWEGGEVFRLGRRRAFISSRRTPLEGLDVERVNLLSETFGRARLEDGWYRLRRRLGSTARRAA